jgi:uncharacterized protein YjbI with pentapeptide repeats
MKIVKPNALGLLTRPFEHRRRFHLGVSVLAFVPMGGMPALLAETVMWPFLAGQLPPEAPLDAVIPKTRGEFLAIAHAHAPGGQPVTQLRVGLKLGNVIKTLGVSGERYLLGDRPTEPKPFTTMPIDWAHAYGGAGVPENPLGFGATPVETPAGRLVPVANVVANTPGVGYRTPASFAPLDQTWPQRARLGGTYDDTWKNEDYPGLPRDIDWAFFNAAPADQQFSAPLRGDEDYAAENLHPSLPLITGHLPGLAPRFFIRRKGETGLEEVPLRLTTVWFFPHAQRMVLVHHGRADLADEEGADVDLGLVGADLLGAPRPAAAFAEVLARRLEPVTGLALALRDDLLVPGQLVVPDPALADAEASMTRSGLRDARQRSRQERAYAKMTEDMVKAGVDPAQIPPLPPPLVVPELSEIPAFLAQQRAGAEATKAGLAAEAAATTAKYEPRFVQPGQTLSAALGGGGGGGPKGPPSAISPPGPGAKLAELRAGLEAMPVPEASPPPPPPGTAAEPLDPAAFKAARLAELDKAMAELAPPGNPEASLAKQREAYQATAHLQSPADPRPPEQNDELRRLLASSPAAARAAYDFSGADLRGMSLAGLDLAGICLDGADLSGCDLRGARLVKAVLAHARLESALLDGADLTEANLGKARLTGASLRQARLTGANLGGADLRGANLSGADLADSRLLDALLAGSEAAATRAPKLMLMKTALPGWRAAGITLERAKFLEVDFTGADFSGASMFKVVFLGCTLDGASFAGADLRKAVFVQGTTARNANFAKANLTGANLRETPLEGADFSAAAAPDADFSHALMAGAKLARLNGTNARFTATSLPGADLRHANFLAADLSRADLAGADLTQAGLTGANMARVRLDTASRTAGIVTTRMRYLPRYKAPEAP